MNKKAGMMANDSGVHASRYYARDKITGRRLTEVAIFAQVTKRPGQSECLFISRYRCLDRGTFSTYQTLFSPRSSVTQ